MTIFVRIRFTSSTMKAFCTCRGENFVRSCVVHTKKLTTEKKQKRTSILFQIEISKINIVLLFLFSSHFVFLLRTFSSFFYQPKISRSVRKARKVRCRNVGRICLRVVVLEVQQNQAREEKEIFRTGDTKCSKRCRKLTDALFDCISGFEAHGILRVRLREIFWSPGLTQYVSTHLLAPRLPQSPSRGCQDYVPHPGPSQAPPALKMFRVPAVSYV